MTDAQKRAKSRYEKAHARTYLLKLWRGRDDDVIKALDEADNRQDLVRAAIRHYTREGA